MTPISIPQELDRLRNNLLDLTLRNSLLNYRKSRSKTVQIIDEVPDFIFERLIRDRKTFRFEPKPEPDLMEMEGSDDETLELPPAHSVGNAVKYRDNRLQTNVGAAKLESLLKGMQRASKTAIEETGINYLHIAVGFLSWHAKEDSSMEHMAPLVLVPVSIERKFDASQGEYLYEVRWTEEDIHHNLCLERFLNRDFGLELPKYAEESEDEDPEAYFKRVDHAVRRQKDWNVRREALIGFFSFHKLLMYADLEPKNWEATDALSEDSLVTKIVGGTTSESSQPLYAPEYDVEDDEVAQNLRLLVDADSSQHSALVDIAKGKNIVIEGPPGTGKSQTITNAIATTIYSGKTVLFVAEKIAALNVVHSKLQAMGLGEFCLELHSDTATSRSVIESVSKRLELKCESPEQLNLVEEKLEAAREELKQHLSATAARTGPKNQPLYEIFWRVVELRTSGYTSLYDATLDLAVVEPQFEHNLTLLRIVAASIDELPEPRKSPWWGFRVKRLRGAEYSEIQVQLNQFESIRSDWSAALDGLRAKFQQPNLDWLKAAIDYQNQFQLLSEESSAIDIDLARKLLQPGAIYSAREFVIAIREVRDCRKSIETRLLVSFEEAAEKCNAQTASILENCLALFGDYTWNELKSYRAWLATSAGLTKNLLDYAVKLDSSGLGVVRNLHEYDKACFNLRLFRHPVVEDRQFVTSQLFLKNALDKIRVAIKHSQGLQQRQRPLESKFHIPSIPDTEAIIQIAKSLRPYVRSYFRFLSGEYRKALSELKRFWRPAIGKKPEQWVASLEALSDIRREIDEFAEAPEMKSLVGSLFNGISTDWSKIKLLLEWVITAQKQGFDHGSASKVMSLHDKNAASLSSRRAVELGKEFTTQLSELKALGPLGLVPKDIPTIGLEELHGRLESLTKAADDCEQLFHLFRVQGTETVSEVAKLAESVQSTSKKQLSLSDCNQWQQKLSPVYDQLSTDETKIDITIRWVENLKQVSGNLELQEIFLASDVESTCSFAHEELSRLKSAGLKWSEERCKLKRFGRLEDSWLSLDTFSESPDQLRVQLEGLITNIEHLPILATLNANLEACEKASLHSFTDALLAGKISQNEIAQTYELSIYEAIAEKELEKNLALKLFSRNRIEIVREQFQKLDRRLLELNRRRVAFEIDKAKDNCEQGISTGRVGEYTELGLIRHETNKQRRFCRIRELLQRAPKSMRSLKPCFMMSPLSVAQFIAPGSMNFDLVIMDEASQIKPEDAIGALLRSKQMVVVGDPKQLPPTSFFDRQQDDIDEDDAVVIDNSESILEASLKSFQPARRLRWHYRSQHESLIQFSNSRFYDGDLVVFPSPSLEDGTLGVTFQHVPGATFADGCNMKEAQAIAKAVVEHAISKPNETIGVGAFNLKQSQIISDFIDKEYDKRQDVRTALDLLNAGAEELFVKNLENLQGDERDVIFISYTYGPDKESGRVMNRFGPINSESGWRRLNVLVTRARRRVKVFASFFPSDITVGPGQSRGVTAFRDYLEFAQTGKLSERLITNREPDSPFEISVAKVVDSMGLRAVPQVGVAGYYIDIGVQCRDDSGEFILGIECDGAAYHSSKSARDRDRLREEVIRSRGWNLHRIWSTDWFQNQRHEERRLLSAIEKHLANRTRS
jgi:very-short-patch-repair endonuclease